MWSYYQITFNYEPIGIPFEPQSKANLSAQSYYFWFERELTSSTDAPLWWSFDCSLTRTDLDWEKLHPLSEIQARYKIILICLPLTIVYVREGRREGRWRRSMEDFEGRRRGMLLRGMNQSATCCTLCKTSWMGIGHEKFGNSGSVLGRYLAASSA